MVSDFEIELGHAFWPAVLAVAAYVETDGLFMAVSGSLELPIKFRGNKDIGLDSA